MANQNQVQSNDFITALADAVNKAQKPTQQQLQEEQELNRKAKKGKTTIALSLSAGLIASAGFALKGVAAGTFAIGPVIGIGAGVAAGAAILLTVVPAVVRYFKAKRAAKKAERNAQIANRKMFFERVGYTFHDKPRKGNIFKRIGLGIAGIFNKEIRAENKKRKAQYKDAKETYNFEKNILYKEPWNFANVNASLIDPNNDPTMEQLVMIKDTPEMVKDEKGVEKKYYRVVSVYNNDKGQKVSFIPEDQLLAMNPKTGKLNCSAVELSTNELNQRIANGYFQQKADILPAQQAVNLETPVNQQGQTQTQQPSQTVTPAQAPQSPTNDIDVQIAVIKKELSDYEDKNANNPSVKHSAEYYSHKTSLYEKLEALYKQKLDVINSPQLAPVVQQAAGLTVGKAQTGAASAQAAAQTQKIDLENPAPAPAAAPTPKEQTSLLLSLLTIIIPPLANWMSNNPEKAAELSKESSNSLVVINLVQKLLEQYQNTNAKDVPVTEETVKQAVQAQVDNQTAPASDKVDSKDKDKKSKSGKNSHK